MYWMAKFFCEYPDTIAYIDYMLDLMGFMIKTYIVYKLAIK